MSWVVRGGLLARAGRVASAEGGSLLGSDTAGGEEAGKLPRLHHTAADTGGGGDARAQRRELELVEY